MGDMCFVWYAWCICGIYAWCVEGVCYVCGICVLGGMSGCGVWSMSDVLVFVYIDVRVGGSMCRYG